MNGKHIQKSGETPYFGSKLFGKYASARDAGNFAAGAVAQKSNLPNIVLDYGFGTYNLSGNSKGKSALLVVTDVLIFGLNPLAGAGSAYYKAQYGKNPLTKMGIEVGKSYILNKK